MIGENQAISEICPLAWKTFCTWSKNHGNEKVMKLVNESLDFRPLIGYYFDFFIQFANENDEIKRSIMKYSPIEPLEIRKNTIYKLFVKLEAHIRKHDNWTYVG